MSSMKHAQLGFSLLEVMISTALLGIVAAGITTTSTKAFKAKEQLQNSVDRESIARFFLDATTCTDTLPTGTCTPGAIMPVVRVLNNRTPTTIASAVPNAGTRYGAWTVRGECDASGRGIVLRAALLQPNGTLTSNLPSNFRPDPLTGKITKWVDSASLLLPGNASLCRGGSGQQMRTEMHPNVLADQCTSPFQHDNLCPGTAYKDIVFRASFRNPPQVMVSIVYACDAGFSPCSGGATDTTFVYAQNVTKTGFTMVCAGSPPSGFCGAESTSQCGARCSWMAIGN